MTVIDTSACALSGRGYIANSWWMKSLGNAPAPFDSIQGSTGLLSIQDQAGADEGDIVRWQFCVQCFVPGIVLESNIIGVFSNSALPVELGAFNARKVYNRVILDWETSSEENNSGFEIQYSMDGRSWEVLTFMKGRGTTNDLQKYSYTHSSPLPGDNYYRLKQMDFNGAFEFSEVRHVRMFKNEKGDLAIYPNPATEQFTVTLYNPEQKEAFVKILDNMGRIVWQKIFKENAPIVWQNQFDNFEHGIYFVITKIQGKIQTKRISIVDL